MCVRHGLVEGGDGGDLLGVRLVAVRQVAAVGEIQAEDAVVRLKKRGVHLWLGLGLGLGLG